MQHGTLSAHIIYLHSLCLDKYITFHSHRFNMPFPFIYISSVINLTLTKYQTIFVHLGSNCICSSRKSLE